MKKIWQKSLASMVSAALCLTAFVGCLTVNAATTYQGTITSDGVEVTETAESANVTLNISSPEAAMNIAAIAATTDFGTLTAVTVKGDNCKIDDIKDLAKGRFYVDAIDNNKGFNTAAVTLTFTKAEKVEVGNHPVTITYFAKESAATFNEDIVNLTVNGDINITVKASTPVCDHANATYDYSVVDGNCITKLVCPDCGNVETVATIASKTVTPNPVVSDGLSIRFRIKQNTVTDFTNLYGTFTKDVYSGNAYNGESELVKINAVTQGTNWQFEYTGIASYEMCSVIHIKIFATDAKGNVVLIATKEYALVDYYKEKLADTSGTYTDAYKNFFVDTLRYGAESQKAMGYRIDVLPTDGIETSYGTALPTSFTNTESPATGSIVITPNTVVGNSVKFRIRFSKDSVASYDFSTLKMTVNYVNGYGNADTDVATSDLFTSASNGKNWQYEFSKLPCASINDYIVIKIFDGETELSSLTYSFQSYALTQYTNSSSVATLSQAIVAYSSSAKVAFGLS